MPDFTADNPAPVYVRAADYLTALIRSGELAPGARLPSERQLATNLGVAYDTIRRMTALLRDRGLIVTVHGRGTYVSDPLPPEPSPPATP